MKRVRMKLALALVTVAVLGVGAAAVAGDDSKGEKLTGYEEVPALSTSGAGRFQIKVDHDAQEIDYRLSFDGLESAATQAHIHFENRTNAGAIVVFLCSNLGNGPVGTQACPADGGAIEGTIRAADIGAGAEAQGIAAGEFREFVRAIRAGATYVNVHSVGRPGGEIRAQLDGDHGDHDGHEGDDRD